MLIVVSEMKMNISLVIDWDNLHLGKYRKAKRERERATENRTDREKFELNVNELCPLSTVHIVLNY